MSLRARIVVPLGIALTYGGSLWLVLLHHAEGGHEAGEPPLLLHWLRDGSLALPGVLVAAAVGAALALRLVDADGRLPAGWRSALIAAGAALVAAFMLAAGSPLHAWLFGAQEAHDLPLLIHLGRDTLIALAITLPTAGAVAAFAGQGRRRPVEPRPRRAAAASAARGLVTRRAFVGYGSASLATAGLIGAELSRTSRSAHAQAPSDRLHLFINEGHVALVDGTLIYMRGYGAAAADDPQPSLTIEPQVFRAGVVGPVASRHFPLDATLPELGAPRDAGIDPSGPGRHFIHRRHWASFFPRRTIVAESGSEIRLRVTNRLSGPHAFTIDGVVTRTLAPGETADLDFAAPAPGTYVYHDHLDAPVNRVLGLHGVLVVVPAANPWTWDGSEGEFERQWLWIFHDIDPEWARLARMGAAIDPHSVHPRYFTINDRSGVFSLAESQDEESNRHTLEDTKPAGHARIVNVADFSDPATGTGQLIRIANTGVAAHQPHFHGNHVWTIVVNNEVLSRSTPSISPTGHVRLQEWEDVVEIEAMETKAAILPIKPPPDALDEVLAAQECDWIYPMHCHAEMSQTAGGGLYPGGAVTDWLLKP